MKIFLILNIFLISLACANISDKNSDKKDSSDAKPEASIQSETAKPDTVIFSVEDSVKFYTACEEDLKLTNQFCECANKYGRAHVECRTFIKEKSKYEKIEDEIINKYYIGEFKNQEISTKLFQNIKKLNQLFNNCK